MIWETYRDEFNRNRLKLSEVWTENLGGLHCPGSGHAYTVNAGLYPGTEASEKVNPRLNIIIYVLKPVCVYSSLLLRCFIDHNISFGNHI